MGERPQMVMEHQAEKVRRRWHFAGVILDETSLEMICGGTPVELERKPLEVLIYLLQHAGEVCTKDELLAAVWPRRVLSETVLTKTIGRIREVLADEEQEIIKTAYGFGYRLVAPVRVESDAIPEPPRLNFQPGDHPPNRPLWSLVDKLGVGGHGEVWRCRHEKTRDQRVFKFALDAGSLGALKREITLFRVINDTLGESARVVKLLDWNLEQFPYFVEAEHIAGGNLIDWARSRGGLAAIPLNERLEIIAQVASALSAIHSVGVLHKDLKPSNILVRQSSPETVEVLLADFGSGVVDVEHLERLGITRLGFTKTVAVANVNEGTPLYLAPEILLGQPFTVKSDLYALGVLLYQIVAADFHRVMSPGWERDVGHELLREDIAQLAQGDPAMRLGHADSLALRLRTLEERHAQLLAEREEAARAERARRALERVRARRVGFAVAIFALAAGFVASTVLYLKAREAQRHSEAAAARAGRVVQFLGNDVFAPISSGTESVKTMSVVAWLSRAGNEIDKRFEKEPEIASQLHFVLGRSFSAMYEAPYAVEHLQRAMTLGEHLAGEGSESAVRSAAELVHIDYLLGKLPQTFARYSAVLAEGRQRLGENSLPVLDLRLRLARGDYLLGNWVRASDEMGRVLADAASDPGMTRSLLGEGAFYHGQMLVDLGRPREAQRELLSAITHLTAAYGEKHGIVADSRSWLARAYGDAGQYAESDAELERAAQLASAWAPPESWVELRPRYYRALLWLHQDQPSKAEPVLANIVEYEDVHAAEYLAAHAGAPPELDHTGPVRQALGESYAREGKFTEAIATLRRAVEVGERADGPEHPTVIASRLSLAESLIAVKRDAEARALLDERTRRVISRLPPIHPILAQWNRASGLLAAGTARTAEARAQLAKSLEIYKALYTTAHWRVVRAQQELTRGTVQTP